MKKEAYGALSLALILATVITLLLGVFWLGAGIARQDFDVIFKGSITLIIGAALGAVTNFLK